jgi:cyanate permease
MGQQLTMLMFKKIPSWQIGLLLFSVLAVVALEAWRIFR